MKKTSFIYFLVFFATISIPVGLFEISNLLISFIVTFIYFYLFGEVLVITEKGDSNLCESHWVRTSIVAFIAAGSIKAVCFMYESEVNSYMLIGMSSFALFVLVAGPSIVVGNGIAGSIRKTKK